VLSDHLSYSTEIYGARSLAEFVSDGVSHLGTSCNCNNGVLEPLQIAHVLAGSGIMGPSHRFGARVFIRVGGSMSRPTALLQVSFGGICRFEKVLVAGVVFIVFAVGAIAWTALPIHGTQ